MYVLEAAFPWLAGGAALGIGLLVVGGSSPWLLAFVLPAIVLGYVVIWP